MEEVGFVVVDTILLLCIWNETSEYAVDDGEIDGEWLPCEVPCLESRNWGRGPIHADAGNNIA